MSSLTSDSIFMRKINLPLAPAKRLTNHYRQLTYMHLINEAATKAMHTAEHHMAGGCEVRRMYVVRNLLPLPAGELTKSSA